MSSSSSASGGSTSKTSQATTAGGAGTTADATTTGGIGLPGDTPVNELSESERAQFCDWATAQAQAYIDTWGDGRMCSAVGAILGLTANPEDLSAARQRCVEARDNCNVGGGTLVLVDCANLTTCGARVADVQAYYQTYENLDARQPACDSLNLDTFDGIDVFGTAVLPNCSLVAETQ